jgi:hypothetical protein
MSSLAAEARSKKEKEALSHQPSAVSKISLQRLG